LKFSRSLSGKHFVVRFSVREIFLPFCSDRSLIATEGALIFKIDANTHAVTLFAALQGCLASDHNGITFDHFGTFGFDMIVTCKEGNVFRIHGDGTGAGAPIVGPFGIEIEGPAVVPPGFGPHGGEIWVAVEDDNAVHAVRNTNPPGPRSLHCFSQDPLSR
jgi:hypothetical protein